MRPCKRFERAGLAIAVHRAWSSRRRWPRAARHGWRWPIAAQCEGLRESCERRRRSHVTRGTTRRARARRETTRRARTRSAWSCPRCRAARWRYCSAARLKGSATLTSAVAPSDRRTKDRSRSAGTPGRRRFRYSAASSPKDSGTGESPGCAGPRRGRTSGACRGARG